MLLNITHRTTYTYERPVNYGLQQLRLLPKTRAEQDVVNWDTQVEGAKKELTFHDHHNNHVTMISVADGASQITIVSQGQVRTSDTNGVIGEHSGFAPLWYFAEGTPLTRAGALTRQMAKGMNSDFPDELERMHALSNRVLEAVTWTQGETDVTTTAEDAMRDGRGVCQDHAHIFCAAARSLGLPARYVSGYLKTDEDAVHDAAHAWAEAYITGLGWVGFDISNGISPDERYVRVATGRDYRDAAPVSGISFGDHGGEKLAVAIQVQQ
ncbi:MAG: transglutaminase family protein [Pseudomonadota bacterium]